MASSIGLAYAIDERVALVAQANDANALVAADCCNIGQSRAVDALANGCASTARFPETRNEHKYKY